MDYTETERRRELKKDIVVFGTGKYFENYMVFHGENPEKKPLFAIDNDLKKVGTVKEGIEIKMPDALLKLPKESFYVVICSARVEEMRKQLESMGIYDYQYYRPVPMEKAVCYRLTDAGLQEITDFSGGKPYKIGYVPGVFDLFHIGHLNLLRNAKSRCEYLIAGVLTDELVEHFKKRKPVIPYEQRAAILEAITYVDRVVPVDFSNTVKLDAWNKYHFDCHFSGNDHGMDWSKDRKQLEEVGATMEFFRYTSATSTTQIRNQCDNA